jgi:hypothetical protein
MPAYRRRHAPPRRAGGTVSGGLGDVAAEGGFGMERRNALRLLRPTGWNVMTRPIAANGPGFSPALALREVDKIERSCRLPRPIEMAG